MARVITITSGKGGVGKTTATANLGVALATLGNKVACVDADIGLRNLDVVMGLENRIVYDIVDVVEGRARLRQAMIRDKRLKEDLYLLPAAQSRDKTAVSPSDMVRLCDELRPLVDFVLIDSPAGIERGFRNAVAPADEVIIVTNPEVSSVRDADRIIGLIEAEGKGPGQLVINRVKPEMVKRGDMLSPEDVIDILAIKLLGLIPEDETILVSTNRGMPVALNVEDSLAGKAFQNIARRIMGEDVPFLSLEEEGGWLQKLFRRKKGGAPAKAERRDDHRPAAMPPGVVCEKEEEQKPEVEARPREVVQVAAPVSEPKKEEPARVEIKPPAEPPKVETKPAEPPGIQEPAKPAEPVKAAEPVRAPELPRAAEPSKVPEPARAPEPAKAPEPVVIKPPVAPVSAPTGIPAAPPASPPVSPPTGIPAAPSASPPASLPTSTSTPAAPAASPPASPAAPPAGVQEASGSVTGTQEAAKPPTPAAGSAVSGGEAGTESGQTTSTTGPDARPAP